MCRCCLDHCAFHRHASTNVASFVARGQLEGEVVAQDAGRGWVGGQRRKGFAELQLVHLIRVLQLNLQVAACVAHAQQRVALALQPRGQAQRLRLRDAA